MSSVEDSITYGTYMDIDGTVKVNYPATVEKFRLIKQYGKALRDAGYDPQAMSCAELRAVLSKTQYGTRCYPGGRTISVISDYPEWTAWAVEVLRKANNE